jgi:hypothetical protein
MQDLHVCVLVKHKSVICTENLHSVKTCDVPVCVHVCKCVCMCGFMGMCNVELSCSLLFDSLHYD